MDEIQPCGAVPGETPPDFEQQCQLLQSKLDLALKQRDIAQKEKDVMVMKYAVGEKHLLESKQQREQFEKKCKETITENELLQHKLQVMCSEKARICQMLDNKSYEHKSTTQELEQFKADFGALETKLKWTQNNLKTEIQLHKECQGRAEVLTSKLQEVEREIEGSKLSAEESIKAYQTSQENRAFVLDQQVNELQASLILLRHERDDKDQQTKALSLQLEKLQAKQHSIVEENNELSLKVQHLERERLDMGQKLSEFKTSLDQQRQDCVDLQTRNTLLDQVKLQLQNEQEQAKASEDQIQLLKSRNAELEFDIAACREREAELLVFTQQLTEKNVRLQTEFTALETRVQQLTCEQNGLKRAVKEHETKATIFSAELSTEKVKSMDEIDRLKRALDEKRVECEGYRLELQDSKGEMKVLKRKYELSLKEVNKELQQCRKKLEDESSNSSSNSSLNVGCQEQVQIVQPGLDRQTLIEHIVKLQRISARKSEKLDFLEEHVNTLVLELQKKSRVLQGYILRDQAGTLSSNSMDNHKAAIAKFNGVMASLYSSRVSDESLTLELSLDINRKLQAVLEDALLKNITLKESVDTLGDEIDRLNKALKS